jgi:polar amino acid transport system permease protein
MSQRRRWVGNGIAVMVLGGFTAWGCVTLLGHLRTEWNAEQLWENRALLIRGWSMTLAISLGAMLGSTCIGALLLAGQRTGLFMVGLFSRLFLELVRATPLLVQLLVGYFLIFAPLMGRELGTLAESALGPEWTARGWDDKLLIGIVLLSLFQGAYLGEIFRSGLESVPQGQIEAARAVGFSRGQIYRYVIFPQALRRILPSAAGQFVSLIKDSSLLSVIGVQEFAYQARAYTAKTYGGIEAYLPLALGYLFLTLAVAWTAHALEKRFQFQV